MIAEGLFAFADILDDIKKKGLAGGLSTLLTGATKKFGDFSAAAKIAGSSLKAFFTSPVGIAAGVLTVAGVGISHIKKRMEELRKEADEAATEFEESSKAIDDYVSRYNELKVALEEAKGNEEETYNVKKQLLELQNELNDAFGDECGKLNLVTNAYADLSGEIAKYNNVKAEQYLRENKGQVKKAKRNMEKEKTYMLGTIDNSSTGSEELKSLFEKYEGQGVSFVKNDGSESYSVMLTADPASAETIMNSIASDLSEAEDKYAKLFEKELYNIFSMALSTTLNSLGESQEILDAWENIYNNALMAEIATKKDSKGNPLSDTMLEAENAIEAYNEAVLKAEDPLTDEDVAKARQKIEEIKKEMSGEDWANYSYVVDNLFNSVDTALYDFNQKLQNDKNLQNYITKIFGMDEIDVRSMINDGQDDAFDELAKSAEIAGVDVDALIDLLVKYGIVKRHVTETPVKDLSFIEVQTNIQNLSKGLDQLDSIYADILEKEDFDWSSIYNNDDFKNTFSNLDGYDEFVETISNSPKDIKACQEAFNNLATSYIETSDALKGVTEETRNASIAQLEQMGIANASEVVDYYIAKEKAAEVGIDFANATVEEINMLALEGIIAGQTAQAIFYYQLQKVLSNENSLSTADDCNQLITLAENCGVTGGCIEDLIRLREIYNMIADTSLGISPGEIENLKAEAAALESSIRSQASEFKSSYEPIAKYTGGLKSAEAASKAAKDAADAYTEAIQKQIDALEVEKTELEKQEEHYEQVIEAINWFYDQQIEKVQDLIDELEEQNELLEEQQNNYDMALSAIDRFYQNQIELIQEEQEAIDKRIEALQEENDERKKQYELEQKQLALERTRNQKIVKTYTADNGYVYMADQTAIKDAENDLADAELDNAVSQLEKEKEKLQESIDKLEEYRELWSGIADEYQQNLEDMQMQQALGAEWESILLEGRIEAVTAFKDQYIAVQTQINDNQELISSYEEKIEYYESLKEEWEKLTNKYKEETYIQLLIGEFGNNYEDELLNGRTHRWETFAEDYANIQKELKDITDKIEALEQKMKEYAASMENSADRMKNAVREASQLDIPGGGSNEGSTGGGGKRTPVTYKAYAKGGLIDEDDTSNLDHFARAVGEDHMVALTEGEAVIPVDTVKANPELVNGLLNANGKSYTIAGSSFNKDGNTFTPVNIPNLFGSAISGFNLDKVAPKYENKMNPDSYINTVNENSVSITIGDIHLSGVQDVNGLSDQIMNRLPNLLIQGIGKM